MDEIRTSEHRWAFTVSGVTAVRVALAALFFYTFMNDLKTCPICLFLFACFTDALDGHLARRLGVSSSLGGYSDVTADFLLILAAFSACVMKRIYPFWTLLLIRFMFLQFILTSRHRQPIYDPVGKYYGVFLFATIGITLAFPKPSVSNAMPLGILGFTVVSVLSRFVFLLSRWRRLLLIHDRRDTGERVARYLLNEEL